jgi:hypothetical protein
MNYICLGAPHLDFEMWVWEAHIRAHPGVA